MQSAPRKDERENVASGSDPLTVFAANADCEINFVHYNGSKGNHEWTRIHTKIFDRNKRRKGDSIRRSQNTKTLSSSVKGLRNSRSLVFIRGAICEIDRLATNFIIL